MDDDYFGSSLIEVYKIYACLSLNVSSPEVVHLLKLTHWQLIGCKTHSVDMF